MGVSSNRMTIFPVHALDARGAMPRQVRSPGERPTAAATRVRIRTARARDLTSVLRIERDVFGGGAYSPSVVRQLMDISGRGMRVATVGGTVAGYAVGSVCTGTSDGWILCVAVRSRFQRKGIGRLLSASVIDALRKHRVARVLLTVHPRKHGAIALYRSLGFRTIRRCGDYFGVGEPRLVMAYTLGGTRSVCRGRE